MTMTNVDVWRAFTEVVDDFAEKHTEPEVNKLVGTDDPTATPTQDVWKAYERCEGVYYLVNFERRYRWCSGDYGGPYFHKTWPYSDSSGEHFLAASEMFLEFSNKGSEVKIAVQRPENRHLDLGVESHSRTFIEMETVGSLERVLTGLDVPFGFTKK